MRPPSHDATRPKAKWMRGCVVLALAGCSAPAQTPSLRASGVDLRPVMNGLREDARSIAVALASRRLALASEPCGRLAVVSIGRDGDPLDAEFKERASELRSAAAELARVIETGRQGDAENAFARVIERCDACHARYRPGAAAIAP